METDLVSDGQPSSSVINVEPQPLVRGSSPFFSADRSGCCRVLRERPAHVRAEVPTEYSVHSAE